MARAALLCLVPCLALAQAEPDLRDLMHARDFSMGGAYRAHGLGAEAAFGNPSALALYRRYVIELSGAWDPATKFGFGTVAVVDSATSSLAMGASYHFVSMGRDEGAKQAHVSTVSFGLPLSNVLQVGAAGRHFVLSGAADGNALTMDAAV